MLLFPFWKQSIVLTVASWLAYRFLRRQVRWSGIPICLRIFQFVVIYTVKGFSIVNEADVFLEFLCFPYDPTDVGNLISGSSVFSKSSLYIWKFLVHILLMPLPAILIPACASSSPAFHMMYSSYKLNKQCDNIQLWHTLFPIWNKSVVPYPVLTVASWPAYRFLYKLLILIFQRANRMKTTITEN